MADRDWETHKTILSGDIDYETNLDLDKVDGLVTDPRQY